MSDAGNIWFERAEHTWDGERCRFCGASKKTLDRGKGLETHAYALIHTDDVKARIDEIFGGDMQFDVIVGNPPYQLDDGGFGTSAAPDLLNYSWSKRRSLSLAILSMIIPSPLVCRWERGWMNSARPCSKIVASVKSTTTSVRQMCSPVSDSRVVFGYFLWERDNPGQCRVTTKFQKDWPVSTATRPLLEKGADVLHSL